MQNQNFFKTRTAGFYLLWAVALLALVESFVYVGCYTSISFMRYYSSAAFAVSLVAVIVSLALSLFRWTAKWAPVVFYGLELCAFGLFIDHTYMYLASQFFGGVSAAVIFRLDPGFLTCAIFFIVILIAGIVAIFLRQPQADLLSAIKGARNGGPAAMQSAGTEV